MTFCAWFDSAPLWQVGLLALGAILLATTLVVGYVSAVTHDWRGDDTERRGTAIEPK